MPSDKADLSTIFSKISLSAMQITLHQKNNELIAKIPLDSFMAPDFYAFQILRSQLLHKLLVKLQSSELLCVMHYMHVLETFERHAQDQPLHIVLCIAAPMKIQAFFSTCRPFARRVS